MSTDAESLGAQYILFNGPLFIGTMFNWALFGTLTLQVYVYFTSGFKDSKWIIRLVVVVFALDILQTVFATHAVWALLIVGWGNPERLEHPPWTIVTFPIMSGILGALVQIFFSWRIWALKKNTLATCTSILIILIAFMQSLSLIVLSIRSAFIDLLDINKLYSGAVVWLVGAFSADVMIVVAMLSILHSSKTSYFAASNRLIDKLMIRVFHSGAITAVAALVELVLFLVAPNNFLYACPVLFLGKLYSNVLMANLNSRRQNDTTFSAFYISGGTSGTIGLGDAQRHHSGGMGEAPINTDSDAIEIKTFKEVQDDSKTSQV